MHLSTLSKTNSVSKKVGFVYRALRQRKLCFCQSAFQRMILTVFWLSVTYLSKLYTTFNNRNIKRLTTSRKLLIWHCDIKRSSFKNFFQTIDKFFHQKTWSRWSWRNPKCIGRAMSRTGKISWVLFRFVWFLKCIIAII